MCYDVVGMFADRAGTFLLYCIVLLDTDRVGEVE